VAGLPAELVGGGGGARGATVGDAERLLLLEDSRGEAAALSVWPVVVPRIASLMLLAPAQSTEGVDQRPLCHL